MGYSCSEIQQWKTLNEIAISDFRNQNKVCVLDADGSYGWIYPFSKTVTCSKESDRPTSLLYIARFRDGYNDVYRVYSKNELIGYKIHSPIVNLIFISLVNDMNYIDDFFTTCEKSPDQARKVFVKIFKLANSSYHQVRPLGERRGISIYTDVAINTLINYLSYQKLRISYTDYLSGVSDNFFRSCNTDYLKNVSFFSRIVENGHAFEVIENNSRGVVYFSNIRPSNNLV